MKYIIGIDLGTSNSAVAVFKNGNVEVIPNSFGNRITPSIVAFSDSERLIGDSAKHQESRNPLNTIYESKRFIGRTWDDPVVQSLLKSYPYKIVNKNNKPYFQVQYKEETKEFSPEEIGAMILSYLKEQAEAYLGEEIIDAVITCPAYFGDAQRTATKDAGTIAGLNVIRVINEPTAASLCYGFDKNNEKDKNVLIIDTGGGTHDLTILTISEGLYQVISTGGDSFLGGADIDILLTRYLADEFKKKNKIDIIHNVKAMKRLQCACETLKKNLSASSTANVEIDSLCDGIDFQAKLTRAKFDDLIKSFLHKCFVPLEQVLLDAKMSKKDINEIVLVGGTTRIPMYQEMISEYFNGKQLCKSINPDEAVGYGAAIQGSILRGVDKETETICLVDVTPLSLGLQTAGDVMTVLIPRGSSIPTSKNQIFTTYANNQTIVRVAVYEGERQFTKDNKLLGEFTLNVPPLPRGIPKINVSFNISADGILQVSATEESTNNKKNITITNDKNRLSKEEIEKMIAESEKYKEEDTKKKELVDAKNNLESYCYSVKATLDKLPKSGALAQSQSDKLKEKTAELTKLVNDTLHWLDSGVEYTIDECSSKQKEIETLFVPLMQSNPSDSTTSTDAPQTHVEEVD